MSSPEASLANLSPMPENGGGERTSVTSGRKCSALLTKSGPLGLSVKMLLESPLWWKEGYVLTWEAKPLCSRRVTNFTDTNLTSPTPSNASAKTLSISDIPSSRCLFRLRLLAHPTEETGSSSSRTMMLITPTSVQMTDPPEKMKARKEKNGYRNGTTYTSLETQVKYDPKVQGLIRTPSAMDARNWESAEYTGGGDFSTRDYAERETQGSTTDPASEMCNGRGAQTGRERQANPDNEEHPVQSAVDGLGEKRTSPHTDCDGQCSPGCGDRCDNRETDCEERECDSLAGTFRPCTSRTVTDSVSCGCQSQEEGGSEPEVRGVIQEQGERGRETKRTDGFPPVPRDASDTECRGSGTLPAPVYTGVADGDEPLRVGCVRTTPDSVREGLEREDESGDCEAGERMCVRRDLAGYDRSSLLPGARWADFPTVSPIHRGNDGIPIRLDNLSIPFSKWRTESLKAYGNAIVPQVMYRIFQAIEFAEANSKTDINF